MKGQTDKAPAGAKEYMVDGKMTNGVRFRCLPSTVWQSGVMSFIINQDGVLLQKDLGKSATENTAEMTMFDPDPGWSIVQQ